MNPNPFKRHFIVKLSSLVLLAALTFNNAAALPFKANAPRAARTPAAPRTLLQFSAGGHILGFTADGMYAATGSHALHVDFLNANNIQPQSDSPASADGKAAALSKVTYTDLWPGISLVYTATPDDIYTTTYSLAPGADPKDIRLHYNGSLSLNKNGALNIAFQTGSMTESAPVAWQDIQGKRRPVDVSFRVTGQEITFSLGTYDPGYSLTIDPSLTWSTFLGGNSHDEGNGIVVDGSGNIYVTGLSSSPWGCLPTTPCTVRAFAGGDDAFAAKLNPSGSLIWNTFLGGGDGYDVGNGIALDWNGNVYVIGDSTASWGCSPASCTVRVYINGNGTFTSEAFAAKLDPSGSLIWNTFLGGGDDHGQSIAMDGNGNVYVTGDSLTITTWGCATVSCTVRAYTSGNDAFAADAFAAKLDPSGSLIWNTFLGGIGDDRGFGIAVDMSENVYVTGHSTASWGRPVRAYVSDYDAFAAKLDPSGSLIWNTFLGGSGGDIGNSIAVDGSGNVYITGFSDSSWGSPVRAYTGGGDAFTAKLSSLGSLTWNTFLGGSGGEAGSGIAVDGSGNVYVTGHSDATWGSPLRAYTSSYGDAFVAKLNSSGNLTWNTFLGGSGVDYDSGIAMDRSGNFYVMGDSNASWDRLGSKPVLSFDAFVAKLDSSGKLIWNTFLNETVHDEGQSIAVDNSGNVYVTGDSDDAWGSPVRAFTIGGDDTFVAKLNSSGNLTWNTFLGGRGMDVGLDIAVDGSGNIYVTGWSDTPWGCSPASCTVEAYTSGGDAFAAKLDSTGSLIWNTFLGASGFDSGNGIAVDRSGNVYVTGDSAAAWGCLPASCTVRAITDGYQDAFAAKLDSSGSLIWNTFLGGSGYDGGDGIAVDGSGNLHVTGLSDTTWGSPVRAYTGYKDAFAAKLDSSGNLKWNTFLGGSRDDVGVGIAVDGNGNVCVTGFSYSSWGRPIRTYAGYDNTIYGNAFAAKLDSSGNLTWNTFLGGSGNDASRGIAVDGSGNVYVTGFSGATWGSPVRAYTGYKDAFATKLNSSGSLTWNTFLGGSGDDFGNGIAVEGIGNVYVTGYSLAAWGTSLGPYIADSYAVDHAAFAAKLDSSGNLK